MAWTPPRTWAASEVLTAALLNIHLRDNLLALGTLVSWTPVWTAGTNPTLGNGTLVGKYLEVGDYVDFFIHLTAGSTTNFGVGTWRFNLPVSETARRFTVLGNAFDTSAADDFPLHCVRTNTGQLTPKSDATTAGAAVRVLNPTTPFTWATGDELYIAGRYEAA